MGRLAVENEIRACQTAGVNLLRIFWPLILLCALTGAAMVVLNYEYVPRLYRQGNELKSRLASAALNSIPAGVPNDDFEDIVGQAKVIFYFRERDLATKDMLQVRMMIERPQGGLGAKQASDSGNPVHEVLMASRGRIETDEQSGLMRIVLFDGAVHSMGEDIDKNDIRAELEARFGGRTDDKAYWEAKRAWAAPPKAPNERSIRFDVWTQTVRFRDAAAIERRPEELTARELLTAAEMGREWPEWKNLKADEGDIRDRINKCLTEFSIRTAFPIACLAFAMMAIPLAIFIRPTGKSIGVAVAFGLVMAYYWMIQWGESIAKSGDRMGHAIIFMPNVLMICLGAYLLRRAVRQ